MKEKNLELMLRTAEEKGIAVCLFESFGSKIDLAIPYSDRVLCEPIEVLNISVRSFNGLRRAGINTVGGVVGAIERGELRGIRNLGRRSESEIKTRVLEYMYGFLSVREKRAFLQTFIQ